MLAENPVATEAVIVCPTLLITDPVRERAAVIVWAKERNVETVAEVLIAAINTSP